MKGLVPGVISPPTSVGKNPTVEVHMKDAENHFMYHHRPELEFSAWTSLFLDSFCRYLVFVLGKAAELKFCPTRVGAGRMLVKERKHTGHHCQDMD